MNNELYKKKKFIFMTLDPIHIGTGGANLGIVDNTIVREAGSNLPIIPGTSLSGAAKMYAAMLIGNLDVAGQAVKNSNPNNPVSYTFGYINGSGSEQSGRAGMVSLSDARIILFPVYSPEGTVWVTTKNLLCEIGIDVKPCFDEEKAYLLNGNAAKGKIKIGWLYIDVEGINAEEPSFDGLKESNDWKLVKDRIYIVSDKLFTRIVNDNLETRTSVAINPETGAAEDRALFTYEAIPRATWLYSTVIQDDYSPGKFKKVMMEFKKNGKTNEIINNWKSPMDVVEDGFKVIEYLGIGGMVTRGFGRMKLVSSDGDD
ncbi:type III-B CRISPR module RAMP protein Cmr4 [Kosmotoga olearia]|jgi:CRISPR-associated protein Cmr4|uniref:CRISPR-associated RAMP protein, Cmr4 family n=1 Tax=Kosmotoga olearia (strain ATCC BAA-1733 / DSM 21960 / TBF 19.5.1) TaxID=521045 RepID=C5CFA3_KOSOT|nr:type III-B CRISPR module RAMP protein Cmr4 [Kosmotoga olearia]ACR79380.1 CRISPR-associated RAMP protein, Cmr4 family [Kosmotoga olearia TBF 19.5.1]